MNHQRSLLPEGYDPHPDDEARAKDLEARETPLWAAEAILRAELMPRFIIDPCVGRGVLAQAAKSEGYDVLTIDIYNWMEPRRPDIIKNYLTVNGRELLEFGVRPNFGVLMNPPFSMAEDFIKHSFDMGARKVICFKQFSFWEGQERWSHGGMWGGGLRPNRIYVCASRAHCWRFDITPEEQKGRSDPTTYAWFVFEKNQPPGTLIWRIIKGMDHAKS